MFPFLTLPRFILILAIPVLVTGAVVYTHETIGISESQPAAFSLAVPFTTQAPDGVWENNANCEEASAVMVSAYLVGDTRDELPAPEVKQSLDALISWEQSNFGYNVDTGSGEIGEMIEANFRLTTKEIVNFTKADLKKELLADHVLILPVNLKLLGNSKYQGAGADYHVIVIRGYTEDGFVVNDLGTTSGKNNTYAFATLQNAAADWDSTKRKLNPARKVVLVVSK